MTDSPFYAPEHHRTLPARQPTPGEPLWSLRQGDHAITCELRGHGEYGWEATKQDLERDGWRTPV